LRRNEEETLYISQPNFMTSRTADWEKHQAKRRSSVEIPSPHKINNKFQQIAGSAQVSKGNQGSSINLVRGSFINQSISKVTDNLSNRMTSSFAKRHDAVNEGFFRKAL
jgi:hypothetical protein